jgi:hypothetical protein
MQYLQRPNQLGRGAFPARPVSGKIDPIVQPGASETRPYRVLYLRIIYEGIMDSCRVVVTFLCGAAY